MSFDRQRPRQVPPADEHEALVGEPGPAARGRHPVPPGAEVELAASLEGEGREAARTLAAMLR